MSQGSRTRRRRGSGPPPAAGRRSVGLAVAAAAGLAVVLLGIAAPDAAAQCSACREALRSGGSEGLIRGIFWSWLLLISVPLSVFATLAWFIVRILRADRSAQA